MKNLFTILFTISCFLTYAADLYVFPGGASPNYSSIHTAVNAANNGDRVLIASGTYAENIVVPSNKDLLIIPMSDGGNYTISGNFSITSTTVNAKTITIVGAIIQGDFRETNSLSSNCGGAGLNEINFINCEFLQAFKPNMCMITNLYYSTLHGFNSGYHYVMSKEIIGNSFLNASGSSSAEFVCYIMEQDVENSAISRYGDDKTLKIYGNYCLNLRFEIAGGNSSSPFTEKVHVANNFFNKQAGTANYLLRVGLGSSTGAPELSIENNTFSRTISNGNSSGWAISIDGSYVTSTIRNNVLHNCCLSSNYPGINWNCSNGIGILTNNLFNGYSYPNTVSIASLSSNDWITGSLNGGSVNADDNFFQSSLTTSDFSATTGICTSSLAIDNGLDLMECRDIDDTQNDLGTWGGPHSWDNYHSTATGKGRIIDVQMPSTIYGLPGVTFEVKSKAIRTN